MNRRARDLITTFALVVASSCGGPPDARSLTELDFGEDIPPTEVSVLRQATAMEILSLDPAWPMNKEEQADPSRFHGHRIMGRATITDPAKMLELLNLVARSCHANDTTVAACFNPRHGVRVEVEGSIVDLQICFECLQIKVFRDGTKVHSGLLASTYEPIVSKFYRDAGLRVAQ